MKTFAILSTATTGILLAGVAKAAVLVGPTSTVKLCTHENMGGDCTTMDVGDCTNVLNHMNDLISSFDTGERICTFYLDENCGGHSYTTKGERKQLPKDFNDQISSLKCNKGP